MNLLTADTDSAHVRFPPPLNLLLHILFGVFLNRLWPMTFVAEDFRWILGALFVFVGLGIILACSRLFKKAHTHLEPWKTTSNIVTTGVYAYSRNPIYLSFVLIGLGISFAADNLWIALMQISYIFFIQRFVIVKEESYLESKFGEEYSAYKAKVRRWI